MKTRLTAILAWTFPVLTMTLVAVSLVVEPVNRSNMVGTLGGSAVPLAFAFTGAVIASRQPRNGIGWLFCFFSFGIPLETIVTAQMESGRQLGPGWIWLSWTSYWLWAPSLTALITYLPLTFPSGRVTGRGAKGLLGLAALGVLMVVAGNALHPDILDGAAANPVALHGHDALLTALTEFGVLPIGVAALCGVGVTVRRYRRSAGTVRQQLKWFVFAMTLAVVAVIANGVLYETGNAAAGQIAFASGFVWLPVALGVAILRHRLYDIDRILSRTVAYALVTAAVVALYLATVTMLAALTTPVTAHSPVAVAAATLLAAWAFQPLRRRIQRAVDRRFNRARYDAARAVDGYRARLRDTLELETLTEDLLGVVRTTLQPTTTQVWIVRHTEGAA